MRVPAGYTAPVRGSRTSTAENALPLLRRGDARDRRDLPVLPEPFEVAEEERLVPDDGTAQRAAVLMAAERGFAGCRLEEAFGVHFRVAQKLPRVAVKLIAAASVRHVDRRAGRAAVFRAHVVGDDFELGDGVGRRLHHLVRESLIARAVGVVVDAVDQEVIEGAAEAVHVERAFARRAGLIVIERRQPHTRRQERERRVLAAVERQRARLIARDDLAARARVGLDQRRGAGHLDSLASPARRSSAHRRASAIRPAR